MCTNVNSKSARVPILLMVPGQLLFLDTIHLLQGGRLHYPLPVRSSASGLDPDDFSMSYLTAQGDLLGTDCGGQFYRDWSSTKTYGAAHLDCAVPYMQVEGK
ncbi:hypothetical protein EYF80_011169 [Liparis tanakae]|uniref:Uncharacterized protein n=1 Tax=Liparis tanakae TaxID=230148 RepID=A0A4Z2IM75_9TELE|nr:hypothetical protein EYF80_011169 [Liparis tanakae]